MRQILTVSEGLVDEKDEHIVITYGSAGDDELVARISPPTNGVLTLQLLIDESRTDAEKIALKVRRRVNWLFIELGERRPWNYAQYHINTASNLYGDVHFDFMPSSR
mgnify:FL=1